MTHFVNNTDSSALNFWKSGLFVERIYKRTEARYRVRWNRIYDDDWIV